MARKKPSRPRRKRTKNETKTLYAAVFAAISLAAILLFLLSRNPPMSTPTAPIEPTITPPAAPFETPATKPAPEKKDERPGEGLTNPMGVGTQGKPSDDSKD